MGRVSVATILGARLRAGRLALGWSQAELAERVELTPNYLGALERGEALPTVDTLVVLANVLGASPASLLGGSNERDEWTAQICAVAATIPPAQRHVALALMRVLATSGPAARASDAARSARRSGRRPG